MPDWTAFALGAFVGTLLARAAIDLFKWLRSK